VLTARAPAEQDRHGSGRGIGAVDIDEDLDPIAHPNCDVALDMQAALPHFDVIRQWRYFLSNHEGGMDALPHDQFEAAALGIGTLTHESS
jgi:hypothetical protein